MGRCKSRKRTDARLLTPFVNNKGYERVCLCKDGRAHHFLVSRLVVEAFCPNPDPANCTVVDHVDGDSLRHALRFPCCKEQRNSAFQGLIAGFKNPFFSVVFLPFSDTLITQNFSKNQGVC